LLAFRTLGVGTVNALANSPVGSWKVTVSPEGGLPFTDGAVFSSDGTLTIMEADGVVGLGVWEKVSGNQYAFTIWEYYLDDGTFIQAEVRSTITLDNSKEQYSGPFFFRVSDIDGNVFAEGIGTAIGVRNHVLPMP
jgi:hypothetical protein